MKGEAARQVAVVCALGLAAAAFGQNDDAETSAPPSPPPAESGVPEPRTGDFDWMRFKNGEWLKGEIKDLQGDNFVFDSDEIGELTLDLDDIAEVYSHGIGTVYLGRERGTVEGVYRIVGDTVTVMTDEGEKTFTREEVRGIIPGRASELNFWSGKLSVGGMFRSGNTNETDFSIYIFVQRRSPGLRLTMEYNGAYSAVNGTETTNTTRLFINNDVYLSRELFLRVPTFTYYRDRFQNVDYRLTPGVLAGYDIIDDSRWFWTAAGGMGYQFTQFVSVVPPASDAESAAVLLFNTRATWEATKKIDLVGEFTAAVPVTGSDNSVLRLMLGADIDVWGDLEFNIQYILDYQSDPARLADGTKPVSNDSRLYFGLAWDF